MLPLLIRSKGKLTPWFQKGGIPALNCRGAYASQGAASLAASYTNLANPGTNNAAPAAGTDPTWDVANGWVFTDGKYLLTGIVPVKQTWSALIRFSDNPFNTGSFLFGAYNAGPPTSAFIIYDDTDNDKIYYASGDWAGAVTKTPGRLVTGVLAIAGTKAYRNGVDEGVVIADSATVIGLPITINGFNAGTGAKVYNIQYAAFYDIVLSPAQVVAVTAAMNSKTYGIVFEGDSLTLGAAPAPQTPYPTQCNTLLVASGIYPEWWNVSANGETVEDMITEGATVDAKYLIPCKRNVAVLWGGVNDIINAGHSAATIFADIVTWCTARKAAGFKTVVLTIAPVSLTFGGFGAPQEAIRVALNALINAGDASIDVVADVASLPNLQDPSDGTYFQDGLHLTTAGYADVAALVVTKI